MTIQTLIVEDVKQAGRDAYDRRQLTAQSEDQVKRQCRYQMSDGGRCIIGWALSDTSIDMIFAKGLNSGADVIGLVKQSVINVAEADLQILTQFQEAHDIWCDTSRFKGDDHLDTIAARTKFLSLIEYSEADKVSA